MTSADRTPIASIVLVGAVVLAGGLRLAGLAYGLPAVYNPDEVAIMNRSMALAQNGLNPHNFLYPSLYFYVLFAWEGLWFAIGRVAGVFDSLASFERAFFVNPTSIYIAGRSLTVLCGVLTVWCTARLAARWFDRTAGAIAALLVAVAPLAVRDAHYVKHDVPVTLLIVLTHVLIAREWLAPASDRRWWRPALTAGLAMSMHYYAIFLAAPLALAVCAPTSPEDPIAARVRRLVSAAAVVVLVFATASPFLVVEPGIALRDMLANRQIVVDRATMSAGAFGSIGFYLEWLVTDGAGRFASILALGGLVIAMRAGWIRAALLLAFPVLFLLFIGNTVPVSRYLNPLVPFVAVLAAAALAAAMRGATPLRWLAYGLVACCVVNATIVSVRQDVFFRTPDTRTLAEAWIERSVPAGTSVLVQPYSVPLRQSRDSLEESLEAHMGSIERASVRFQRELALSPYPAPAYRLFYLGTGGLDVDKIYVAPAVLAGAGGLTELRRLGISRVILKRFGGDDPSLAPIVAALTRHATLEARFSPYRLGVEGAGASLPPPFVHNTDATIARALARPGPVIEVWRID